MKEHHIPVEIAASFYTLNELTEKTEDIWLVCHGWGQLARFFGRRFKVMDPEKNFLVFPQGLSKFYIDDHKRVGATWMTREDRLTEITNQGRYLDAVVKATFGPEEGRPRMNLMGFSQGVSTICRYTAYSKIPFHRLVLWAGVLPPELKAGDFDFMSPQASVKIFLGDNDRYYTPEVYREEVEKAALLFNRQVQYSIFNGGHEVDTDLLSRL